jgi:hypothetical protein
METDEDRMVFRLIFRRLRRVLINSRHMNSGERLVCSSCGYPLAAGEHGPGCPQRNSTENTPRNDEKSEFDKERGTIAEFIEERIGDLTFRAIFDVEHPERVDHETFRRALDRILEAESVSIPEGDRLALFRATLEYYAKPREVEKPLWHSTNSYGLRNALETGFAGGHGRYSGEGGQKGVVQDSLSVSHPDQRSAESFQQLFARAGARKEELDAFIAIDSEKITSQTIPETFVRELLASLSKEELRQLVAKRSRIAPDRIDDEALQRLAGPDAMKQVVQDLESRQHLPNVEFIRKEILKNESDQELRDEIIAEAEHPFPVMVTFEASGKQEHLTTVSRGEKPTHIPFEDFYWDKLTGEDIREIRVPKNQIKKVRTWLKTKGLEKIDLVPIEVYEVKRVISDTAESDDGQ